MFTLLIMGWEVWSNYSKPVSGIGHLASYLKISNSTVC